MISNHYCTLLDELPCLPLSLPLLARLAQGFFRDRGDAKAMGYQIDRKAECLSKVGNGASNDGTALGPAQYQMRDSEALSL